jgi:thiamine-phosphate pyrophosphorylase
MKDAIGFTMEARQTSWPRAWLMTDERLGDRLWEALDKLPEGAGGIVFRHYSLNEGERLALGEEVASVARERGLTLAVAGSQRLAAQLNARLVHNPDSAGPLPLSRSVHDEGEAMAARNAAASLAFISPMFSTRSHPDRSALGVDRALALAEISGCPAIALGGLNAERFEALRDGFHGWAAIDAWLRGPSRE